MLGRRLAVFRGESGRVAVLDARCPHQGADLARGEVVGNSLRCPFHAREFNGAGRCTHIPGRDQPPPLPPHHAFPVAERHGTVYLFNGPRALFPLPFFRDEPAERFAPARAFHISYDAPWQMIACNAFDLAHFSVVHDRRMIGTPVIDTPERFARRIRYRVAVCGSTAYDKLLARFVGAEADVDLTVWAGNVVAVVARFARATSYVFFTIEPVQTNVTRMQVVAYHKRIEHRGVGALLARVMEPIALEIRRLFCRGFVKHENDKLDSIRYAPGALLEEDRPVVEYLKWLADSTKPGDPSS